MEESGGGAANGGGQQSVRVPSALETVGGRQRFEVELRPGETTIVSWKKLVKDASKANKPISVPEPPPVVQSAIEARLAPGPPAENEAEDAPPASRFSAVIEKIERLYMGKNSSDEEDLNDVPDDDEYDTEDSFIDDTELDEYFQVDNSAIKHDGFFVNRGKLERTTNEPVLSPNQQPKKRRRKDITKGPSGNEDGNAPNKQVKVAKKNARMSAPTIGNNAMSLPHVVALPSVHRSEDMKLKNQIENSAKKIFLESKTTSNPSPSRVSNGGNTVEEKDNDKHKTKTKIHENKLKDASVGLCTDHLNQKSSEKNLSGQSKSQPGKLMNNADELDHSGQRREKNSAHDKTVAIAYDGKNSMQTAKTPGVHRKEGSSVKQKSSMLEKAIRELEKMVAESRPQSMEVSDADNSSQAVKKRMPPEIKQKLAKVARLAQASHGSITTELLNRLMSILGHLIQLRTLKRNLKIMVKMGVAAKQVKDDRFQQIKREIEEMVKARVPFMKSKAIEQQAGSSDDFQETGGEEKDLYKRKCSIDDALEDRICNLYDVYVEGLDEDAAPHCRKLYTELAELWPKGFMDNHGIKRAICRAKDRKKALNNQHKSEEKTRTKKSLQPKADEAIRVETTTTTSVQDKSVTGSGIQTAIPAAARIPTTTTTAAAGNGPNPDRPKQDKSAKTITTNLNETRTSTEVPVKKKIKRKPESDLADAAHAHARPEKLTAVQGDEKHKTHKQVVGPAHNKSNNIQTTLSSTSLTANAVVPVHLPPPPPPPAQPSSEIPN